MSFCRYDAAKDKDAACRILHEVGWLEKGKKEDEDAHDIFMAANTG